MPLKSRRLDFFDGNQQQESFHQFDSTEGQLHLRYALAMRMQKSCCDCHNTHPESTKTDWQPGQVRGILEVIRPLNHDTQRTRRGLQKAFGWMAAIIVGTFAVSAGLLRITSRR